MQMDEWRVISKSSRKLGSVWAVTRCVNGIRQKGYFKFPCKQNLKRVDTLLANELIAYQLAKLLNVPAAHVELAEIMGKRGIVSIVQPASAHYSWYQLCKKCSGSPFSRLEDPEQLLRTFIFDIWICNVDRHSDNLIAIPKGAYFSLYAIDHGLCLLGAMKWRGVPWDSSYWQHICRYNVHYPIGMRAFIRSYHQLEQHIAAIEGLPPSSILAIIDQVPPDLLLPSQKDIVKKILLSRQQSLRSIVWKWCVSQRKNRGLPPNGLPSAESKEFEYYYYQ